MSHPAEDQVAAYWKGKVNHPDFVKTEINWAQWVRTKYEALVSAGFSKEEAFEIMVANVSTQNVNIHNAMVKRED
jgi:hypothetical protein